MQLESEALKSQLPLNTAIDQNNSCSLNKFVIRSLEDSKAEDVISIDITGKNPMFDFIVVACGRSHRHVKSIAEHLLRNLKSGGFGSCKVEGLNNCDWVLIDANDVVVHIFRPEVRGFYNLEKMWSSDEYLQQQTQG